MTQIDPHQLGGVAIGADGEDGGTDPGSIKQQPHEPGQDQGHDQTAEADIGNRHAAELKSAARVGRCYGPKVSGKDHQQQADDDEIEAEG